MRVIRMAVLVCLSACLFEASAEEGVWLSYQVGFQSQTSPPITDLFRAVVSARAGVAAGQDLLDVLKPPTNPGGDWIRSVTRDTGSDLAIDFRQGSETSVDAVFPVEIFLHTDHPEGLSGTIRLELMNPSALSRFGSDIEVYIQRFDPDGKFIQKIDLKRAPSITEWDVSGLSGKAGLLRLVIVRECIAANIDRKDSVNLADMAMLAGKWQNTDYMGPEDIDGNASVALTDLALLAEAWLQRCP